jgi:hypothetical protein
MARLDRTFAMQYPPEKAQELFVRDVVPAFAEAGEFVLEREAPGELHFSEGDVATGAGEPDEPPLFSEQDLETAGVPLRAQELSTHLSRGFARHIKVEFTPDGEGTRVEIKGHAEHDVRDAIDRLGTPGHWPETVNDPHD